MGYDILEKADNHNFDLKKKLLSPILKKKQNIQHPKQKYIQKQNMNAKYVATHLGAKTI